MQIELKKRIFTSLILFLLLILMFKNLYIFTFSIMVISIYSFLEFSNLIRKIFYKRHYIEFLFNIIFIAYIFLFSILFTIFNQSELKSLLFFSIIICAASDIGGLVSGKLIKGPKLTKISPNKTIAGSIGSFLFCISTSFMLIYFFTEIFDWRAPFALAIFISLSCQIGDIFFSYLKRKAKIKDTGNILPGHGGMLDRIDGILVGVPFGIILTSIFYIIIQ